MKPAPQNGRSLQLNAFQQGIDRDVIYEKNLDAAMVEAGAGLRLLNWNIERGYDPIQLADYIRAVNPDVVCLQEVDWHNRRTNNRDVLDILARKTGMKGYLGIEFLEVETPLRGSALAGGGAHGNAILTKIQPAAVYRMALPLMFDWGNPPAGTKPEVACQLRLGARFALCADFVIRGRRVTICSAHLEDNLAGVDGRIAQLTHLVRNLENQHDKNDAVIIAGDLNTLENWLVYLFNRSEAEPSKAKPWYISEARWLKTRVLPALGYEDPFSHTCWTYMDSWIYREKLDWVLLKNAAVSSAGRGAFNSSDHRPLWVEIKL